MTADTDLVTAGPSAPDGWIAGTWTIDPAHTTVSFVVRHLMSRVRGTFSEVSGQIVTHPDLSESATAAWNGSCHDPRYVSVVASRATIACDWVWV